MSADSSRVEGLNGEPALGSPIAETPFAETPIAETRRSRSRWEGWLDGASDWINPILVKESRQAMKSRQFVVTFSLLLLCCWGWSLLGVALRSPSIAYVPGGRYMLIGYFLIMSFPLTIIIPFTAYRSLAAEREDGTYELLSISSLRPRQIVGGKLGSATLQMIVYLSVLAPCMAFTYLLRGVDIVLIVLLVLGGAMICWFLSALGLLLATLTRERHWQVLVSVIFVLFLGVLCLYLGVGVSSLIASNVSVAIADAESWRFVIAIGMWIMATGAIMFLAATARLTNRSENRSTPLRVGMLAYHMLLLSFCTYFFFVESDEGPVAAYVISGSILWGIFGSMMCGEQSPLSQRVRRGLPATLTARLFLTLFYPGSGTGYLFAVANMWVLCLATWGLATLQHGTNWPTNFREITNLAFMLACYATFYLGLSRLLLRSMARRRLVGPVQGFISCTALITLGVVIPIIIQFSFTRFTSLNDDYSLIQLPNLFWTCEESLDLLFSGVLTWLSPLSVLVAAMAAIVLFVNAAWMSVQLIPQRIAVPRRVLEDDAAQRPPLESALERSSPWD